MRKIESDSPCEILDGKIHSLCAQVESAAAAACSRRHPVGGTAIAARDCRHPAGGTAAVARGWNCLRRPRVDWWRITGGTLERERGGRGRSEAMSEEAKRRNDAVRECAAG